MAKHLAEAFHEVVLPKRAWVRLNDWGMVWITGPQREKFCKGLVTNKIRNLSEGEGNLTLILTVKGKIISELVFLRRKDALCFVTPPRCEDEAMKFFDHYHVIEDIEIHRGGPLSSMLLFGDDCKQGLVELGLSWPTLGEGVCFQEATEAEEAVWGTHLVWPSGIPCVLVCGESAALDRLQGRLAANAFSEVSGEAWEESRSLLGFWDSNLELRDLLVHEARLEETHVHFNKGCWVGQEVVARTQYRGRANKLLGLVSVDRREAKTGDILIDESGKQVGELLHSRLFPGQSTVFSAIVRVGSLESGEKLYVQSGEERSLVRWLSALPAPKKEKPRIRFE